MVLALCRALISRELVGGSRRMLAINVSFDHPVGLDHPEWILETVESGDLSQDRLVSRDVEPLQNLMDELRFEFPVLVGEGVNRRKKREIGEWTIPSKNEARRRVPRHIVLYIS